MTTAYSRSPSPSPSPWKLLSPSPSNSYRHARSHWHLHRHSHPLSLSHATSVFRVPARTPATACAVTLTLGLVRSTLSAPVVAADADPHQAHHPTGTTSAPAAKGMSGKARTDVGPTDTQLKVMQAMHDKMMAARTPEERNALMAEHMKATQEGMGMMKGMGDVGANRANSANGANGANGGMGAMAGPKRPPTSMSERQTTMEQRMDMMQTMMEMMVDRLPQTPAKP